MKSMRLAVLLLVSSLCFAQEFSRYEVSGGVSYGGIDTSDVKSPKGFAGSFATNVNRWLSMETSVGAQLQTQSVVLSGSTTSLNTGFYSFLSGPRLSYRRGRVTPFAHGLFGWARSLDYTKATYNASNLTFTVPYGNQLGAAAGGGMDYWVTPHIAVRTQGDYFLTQPDGTFGFHMTNNFRIVGGIVFSFGSTPTMTASMKPHTHPSRRQSREDVLAKQESQAAAPLVVANTAMPTQPQLQPASQPVPGATMGAIQSSSVVAKQTSTPAPAPAPVATITPKQDPFTPPAKPASAVVNTTPAPAPVAAVVPRQPPVTPAKPAATNSVANTAPAAAPVTRAAVQTPPPAPAPTVVARPPAPARVTPPPPQPEEQFSLGEYARKLREKKESQPKDWN